MADYANYNTTTMDPTLFTTTASSSSWYEESSSVVANNFSSANSTNNSTDHQLPGKRDRIVFFEMRFEHHQTQLTFAFWFFITIVAKIVFHRLERIKGILPDSALLLVLGSIFGGILHFMFPDQEIYLEPDWFFLYLLPPIALEAGYFMPNKDFFRNIGTITTYAVVGTIWNTAATGATLYMLNDYFHGRPSPIDLFLFATLISAVDPVAVICVFEEIHVNQLLYICVFGESLLNDAVTIVLYHTLKAIAAAGPGHVLWSDYLLAAVAFFWVSIGGILVGAIWAVLTGIVTKWASNVSVVQPLTCLLFPYLAYLLAESLGLSGILAIVVCGMGMKQYLASNISEQSLVTVNYFMKTLSSSCEAVIFVFLGLSAVSKNHDLDFAFIAVTLCTCFIYRFIGVAVLTWLVNKRRLEKIGLVDQFIMGYGGIRGAVCYGLVMSLSPELVCCRNMLATTTIIVILFTVFIQGGTIKKLVTYLKVKQHEVRKKTVFELLGENVCNHVAGGVESIAGLRGNYWLRMTIERFNDRYLRPFITLQPEDRCMKIVKYNEEIQVTEAVSYLKKHGSFAGMPTVQSSRDLVGQQQPGAQANGPRMSFSQRLGVGADQRLLTVSQRKPQQQQDSIPRNESVSVFVRDKFDEMNSSQLPRYSRHFLDGDFRNLQHSFSLAEDVIEGEGELELGANEKMEFCKQNNPAEDDENYYKTYPYSKANRKDHPLIQMRKSSKFGSNKELEMVPETRIRFLAADEEEEEDA